MLCWLLLSHAFPESSWTLSVDLWQAANFQAANCRTVQHLPLHRLIFPAHPPPPLCIIGKECRFYQETDALLISAYLVKEKFTGFISTLYGQYIYQRKEFSVCCITQTSNSFTSCHCFFKVLVYTKLASFVVISSEILNYICKTLLPSHKQCCIMLYNISSIVIPGSSYIQYYNGKEDGWNNNNIPLSYWLCMNNICVPVGC